MSPEQARGETDLDPRSDVWALCVLIYECLVGKPPFHGDNYNALLWAIIHDEPVPITVFQAGDTELWRILKRGFAKDRNVRWESARKLGEALAAWLESHGIVEDVCNRSLNASWLPAERPTRPELAPFDPHAVNHRGQTPGAVVAAPTLAGLRRPHAMSLWFAGLGLLTLVGALFLSSSEGRRLPLLDEEVSGRQKVGALLPEPAPDTSKGASGSPAALPGTVAPAGMPPGRLRLPDGEEPIGTVTEGSNESWKNDHERQVMKGAGLAGDSNIVAAGEDPGSDTSREEASDKARPSPAPAKAPAAKVAPNKPAAASTKPKPRPAPKKAAPEASSADTEVDFGI
jgi:serine/threonine-protein kinase